MRRDTEQAASRVSVWRGGSPQGAKRAAGVQAKGDKRETNLCVARSSKGEVDQRGQVLRTYLLVDYAGVD